MDRLTKAETLIADRSAEADLLADDVIGGKAVSFADLSRAFVIRARHARRSAQFERGLAAVWLASEGGHDPFRLALVCASLLREEGRFGLVFSLLRSLRRTATAEELAEIDYECALTHCHLHNPLQDLDAARELADRAFGRLAARPEYARACAQIIAYSSIEDPDTPLAEATEALDQLSRYDAGAGTVHEANIEWLAGLLARKACRPEASLEALGFAREAFSELGMPRYEALLCMEVCLTGTLFGDKAAARKGVEAGFRIFTQIGRHTEALSALIMAQQAIVQDGAEALTLARIARRKMLRVV